MFGPQLDAAPQVLLKSHFCLAACSDHEIEIRVAAIGVLADLADGDLDVKAVKDDPDDDKYLIAALLGRAGFVVSGDHHLLDLGEYQGVRIVKPR